jgi:AcrR family transcriptional regulator
MTTDTKPQTDQRTPLSRERVLEAAVAQADQGGLTEVSMRKLAQSLGVEAMSLYNHVDGKEDVLDGMLEIVMGEINEAVDAMASEGLSWKTIMRNRILGAREVLLRHKWAPRVIETRTQVSQSMMGYFEAILETFVTGGFSYDLAHHAMHALGSRALGFSQELFEPEDGEEDTELDAATIQQMAAIYPQMAAMLDNVAHEGPDTTIGWCDDQTEFEFGLDLILDGLDRRLASP